MELTNLSQEKEQTVYDWIKSATDLELEIFVRRRLGQENPEFRGSRCGEPRRKHLRLNFDARTWNDISDNIKVLALFQDCFPMFGLYEFPFKILAIKGNLEIYKKDDVLIKESGEGTVSIIMKLLRLFIHSDNV